MSPYFILWTLNLSLLQLPPGQMPPGQMQMPPGQMQMPPGQMQMPPGHPLGVQLPVGGSPGEVPLLPPSHPPLEGQAAGPRPRFADLPDLISRLDQTEGLRESPKTFEVAGDIASQYANANRIEEAAFYFGQAWEKTEEVRAFFFQLREVEAQAECEEVNAGKELALEFAKAKGQTPQGKQAACVRLLMPRVVETGKQLALFQMLAGEMEGARKTWEALWALDNASLEASYALGVLLLETEGEKLASLERARMLLKPVAEARHPRAAQARGFLVRVEAALAAGGNARVQRPRSTAFKPAGLGVVLPAASSLSEAQAMEAAERFLAQKQYAQARDTYLRLLDGNQLSARAYAGLAFALFRLGTSKEMAERLWEMAEQSPEAVEALAHSLRAKGEEEGAQWVWEKLSPPPK